jgi:hypothetical protein
MSFSRVGYLEKPPIKYWFEERILNTTFNFQEIHSLITIDMKGITHVVRKGKCFAFPLPLDWINTLTPSQLLEKLEARLA